MATLGKPPAAFSHDETTHRFQAPFPMCVPPSLRCERLRVAPIHFETAEKLEMVLGVPARFWNRRESQYRAALMQEK
jgi:hypothetical protein